MTSFIEKHRPYVQEQCERYGIPDKVECILADAWERYSQEPSKGEQHFVCWLTIFAIEATDAYQRESAEFWAANPTLLASVA